MSTVSVSKINKHVKGTVTLSGSKSISNRVLIIRSLCKDDFNIENLSDSDDTKTLEQLLDSKADELDAHHAGTTYRFLTSLLATNEGEKILTGSERMQERPIKELVDALNSLGANISYVRNEGFPPLRIGSPRHPFKNAIELSANISSQYISSLLLIAPTLPEGLTIHLKGEIVSKPYLEMTLGIMEYFGIKHSWEGQSIVIRPQNYKARDFYVEADWSAASYYYVISALSDEVDLTLKGLDKDSLQGDSAISEIGESFGISTTFGNREIHLAKSDQKTTNYFEYDFIKCPDIAQSVSTMAAGLGTSVLFSGLQTLRIKETDRIAALQNELAKVQVYLSKLPDKFSKKSGIEYYLQEGKSEIETENPPSFATYKDHRMAMSFAPLGMLSKINIEEHKVVSKSYPSFWNDLQNIGFIIE